MSTVSTAAHFVDKITPHFAFVYSCGFLYLRSQMGKERNKCCKGGYVVHDAAAAVRPLLPMPAEVVNMIKSNIPHFSSSSALYNRMLSIADTQLENGRGGKAEQRGGESAYTINGCVTYFMRKDALLGKGGLSYYTYDGLSRLADHAADVNQAQSAASLARHGPRAKVAYLSTLFGALKEANPYCSELRRVGDRIVRVDEHGIPAVRLTTHLTATINGENNFFEVAAFTADNARANRSFQYRLKGINVHLNARDARVEALVFPLLFFRGEGGYEPRRHRELPFNDYMRARLLMPEPGWESPSRLQPSDVPGWHSAEPFIMKSNRFQHLARLASVYVAETVSRAQDYRLGWHRGVGRATIFGMKNTTAAPADSDGDYDERNNHDNGECSNLQADSGSARRGEIDEDRETFAHSSPSFLAESFTGSPRHLKKLAQNALVIVSELGPPTVFITLTCNAKDPVILARCFEGQSAFDRAEIVTQVFHAKLSAFLHNLRHGKYLGGRVSYLMYVIEYQVCTVV